jgi:hypothetical protein
MTIRVVSILGGRPHLIKSSAVHRAFSGSGMTHTLVESWLGSASDYPGEGHVDFGLSHPTQVLLLQSLDEACEELLEQSKAFRAWV